MPNSEMVKQLKVPSKAKDVWVDVLIGQAQFGLYTVTLYDQNGKNPKSVGSGNNYDTLPDSFDLNPIDNSFANCLIGWTITIASPDKPNGQMYYARVVVREGTTSLSNEPIEYSGALDGAKIIIGFAKFSNS
jgi:hypothetical protein